MNRLHRSISWADFSQGPMLQNKYGAWIGTLIELISEDRFDPYDRLWCATQPHMLEELHRDTLIIMWATTNDDQKAIDKFLNYLHHEQFHFIRNRQRANQYRDNSRIFRRHPDRT